MVAESLTHGATVKEAIQKRINRSDHSSIIPGIDVNELKHSLDILKYALDYSEAIVDTVRLPLIVLDKRLCVLTANKSFYNTFKISPKDCENQLIYELNDNAWDIHKLRVLLEKILPTNTHFDNYELEIDFPHIGKRVMLLNARKTYRQVNSTQAILLAFEDITDRRQLETQKDDFIAIVSHELKTPLTSIKAFAQILEKHLEKTKDGQGKFYLSKMSSQIERLTQLMASFVNVYKIHNGKLSFHKTNFLIDKLTSEIVEDFQSTSKTHKLLFKDKTKARVFADADRISQVLVNLISNAIKYSPNASKVVVSTIVNEGNAIVSVQDFGLGIAKEHQEKIFDRFFRVTDNKERNISGLGLGLYISSEIVTQHKGKMWLVSKESKGSTFYFSIPIQQKHA